MEKDTPDFKKLFESLPGQYLILLPDSPKFTIVAVSDAYNRQTLTIREEIVGKGLFEVFPDNPEERTASGESNLSTSLLRVLHTKKPDLMAVQRYDIPRPKGGFEERYWTPTNTPILDDEGNILYIIHQVEDVTVRVKLKKSGQEMDAKLLNYSQELSKAHAELKKSSRQKDIFLATLAHELRNPLAPIRSGVELLKMDNEGSEIIPTVERQIHHMEKLIDDLTDSSRISRGKLKLNLEEIDLSKLLQDIFNAFKQETSDEQSKLELELPQEKIYLKADPVRVSQVITNLINNSQKFTPPEGKIQVSACEQNGKAIIKVIDEGIGVEKDKLSSIFDMFVQVDKPAITRGLGLGLAISKMLIEMHHGNIRAYSEGIGTGLEMKVELPTIDSPTESIEKETKRKRPNNLRILVADDNADAAKMLKLALEKWNNEVELASNGQEAIDRAKIFKPDLILMDLGMPIMDGHEATSHILSQPWGKSIPVVALSGWGEEADKERTKALGFKGHLVKPVSLEQLQEQILSLLGP